MLRINELKIYEDLNEQQVIEKAKRKYHIKDVISAKIIKKSIDARDKKDVHYNYALEFEVKDETKYPKLIAQPKKQPPIVIPKRQSKQPIVIIGAGPAGLFCGLTLVEYGYQPIIIEQGNCVEQRIKDVNRYRQTGQLNPSSNVQFGEGGAGTFSDGKLTTGINSPYIQQVLETFHRFGAPKEITYLNKPHIGTDYLVEVCKNIRHYIESKGGRYYFQTKFVDFQQKDGQIKVICDHQTFQTDAVVLAIGHSARSTFELLKRKNVAMKRKNFSVGVRIEHLQTMINQSQYGDQTALKLPAADYKLVYHGKDRTCYSFCMCPGGQVIASASEEQTIVTNGMSYFARDGKNANAALLVNVSTSDFEGDDPLSGMYFQQQLETKAYQLTQGHGAPIQRVEDFHQHQTSDHVGKVIPTYQPEYRFVDLHQLFPAFVTDTLEEALVYFDKKIKGFNDCDAILTAPETRTSSPITILRDENYQMSIPGFYPCGEGAGYAGGITSAAVDGIKIAIKILEQSK